MSKYEADLAAIVREGRYAQHKLDGDPEILGPDDYDTLKSIVNRGKHAEETCRQKGFLYIIEQIDKAERQEKEHPYARH